LCTYISDGLEQDLSHILTCSKVGAGINLEALPLSSEVAQHIANTQDWCVALAPFFLVIAPILVSLISKSFSMALMRLIYAFGAVKQSS
jgi:hypothetical protein